jgi:hypothetical protein
VVLREYELALGPGTIFAFALPEFNYYFVGQEAVSFEQVVLVFIFQHLELLKGLFVD